MWKKAAAILTRPASPTDDQIEIRGNVWPGQQGPNRQNNV